MNSLGSHSILELYGCPPELLNDEFHVLAFAREAARRARCTILGEVAHGFEPQGVTAMLLLAESHISVHTWPESGYAAVDVFTCGTTTRPEEACRYLARMFQARRHEIRKLPRGAQAPQPRNLRVPVPDVGEHGQALAAAEG